MATNTQIAPFPRHIELTIKLKVIAENQEDQDYFIDPQTNELSLGAIADLYDCFQSLDELPLSINGRTFEEIHKALSASI